MEMVTIDVHCWCYSSELVHSSFAVSALLDPDYHANLVLSPFFKRNM